jgi:hypothetical protein
VLCLIAFLLFPCNVCAVEEHLSMSYARVFEKMNICKTAELDEKFDEVPPGMETGLVPLPLMDKNIYQPSKSVNSIPLISRYITLALCRQKLHENVVREWTYLFSDTISKCLGSWYTRRNAVPKSADGSSKLKEKTYYRKRKFEKTCQAKSSKRPVEISMDEQLSKPLCQLVDRKIYVKNIQEPNKSLTSKRVSFVDKPSEKGAKTVANDAYDLNIQQDLTLLSSEVPKSKSYDLFFLGTYPVHLCNQSCCCNRAIKLFGASNQNPTVTAILGGRG